MIRPATAEDYNAIKALREELALDPTQLTDPEYNAQMQTQGFLLPSGLDRSQFGADISGYAIYEEGVVLGYLFLKSTRTPGMTEDPDSVEWLHPGLKAPYYDPLFPHAYISGVGVSRRASHLGEKGGGGRLLADAEDTARRRGALWLFSMIVSSPIVNQASWRFHEKHGFIPAAITKPTQECGLSNFRNLLLAKKL